MALSPESKQLMLWQKEDIQQRMSQFLYPFLEILNHSLQRHYAEVYFKGRFFTDSRRTSEPLARSAKVEPRKLQNFIAQSRFSDRSLRDVTRDRVAEVLGRKNGVLIVDASGFTKSGTHTVGVQRQYNGNLGKIDNCVVGEFLAYAGGGSVVLVDGELYLSEAWLNTPGNREKCHVPEEVVFKKGHELALAMVLLHAEKLPHCCTVGDESYGRVDAFRDGLRAEDERYLGEIPHNRTMRQASGTEASSAKELGEKLLKEGAQKFVIRDSEKGPVEVEAAKCRVMTGRAGSTREVAEVFVVVTNKKDSKTWWYLGTDDKTSLKEWVRIASCRTGIEYSFQMAKGEVGMAEFETRSFVGWHHHMTLTMMALLFLVEEQRWLKKGGYVLAPAKCEELWPTYISEFGLTKSSPSKSSGSESETSGAGKRGTELDASPAHRAPKSASRGRRTPQDGS
jgi:SRSO17 transposase